MKIMMILLLLVSHNGWGLYQDPFAPKSPYENLIDGVIFDGTGEPLLYPAPSEAEITIKDNRIKVKISKELLCEKINMRKAKQIARDDYDFWNWAFYYAMKVVSFGEYDPVPIFTEDTWVENTQTFGLYRIYDKEGFTKEYLNCEE